MQQRCPYQPGHRNDHADADQTQQQRTRHPRLWIAAAEPLGSIGHAANLVWACCSRIARFRSADFVTQLAAGAGGRFAPACFCGRSHRKKRLCSLRVHCSLRSLRLALVSRCLPHSLADEKRVCSFARPGQRRASLAQHGGRAIPDARSISNRSCNRLGKREAAAGARRAVGA